MYRLICKPDDSFAARNCLALLHGRLQILLIEESGQHADTTTGLHSRMSKLVVDQLSKNETFQKLARASRQLADAKAELASMHLNDKAAALQNERDRLANELPANAAIKIQEVDRKLSQLTTDSETCRARISLLQPMVDSLRVQVELTAKELATRAVGTMTEELNEQEIKASALFSKAANPHVKALADCKTAKQSISRYHNSPDFARFFCDAALSQGS